MTTEGIVSAIAEHPWVGAVRRTPWGALLVRPSTDAMTFDSRTWSLVGEYLQNWANLYDWAFTSADLGDRAGADIVGLTGGSALTEDEVREWVEQTAALVLESRPRRVLDLGCGTGLLLRHLQGHIGCYVGADLSRYAVDRVREARLPYTYAVIAGAHRTASPQVKRAMTEVMGAARPDCVLINNVAQCFPGTQYLAAVLGDAINLVEPGGRVILGDLRHHGLSDEYHRQLTSGPRWASGRFDEEEELLLDPRLVAFFASVSGRKVKVSVRAKTLRGDNEITRYRYDVVLHVETQDEQVELDQVHWEDLPGNRLEALARLLEVGPVVVTGIPNALLTPSADGATANALSAVLKGTGLAVEIALDDPRKLDIRPSNGHTSQPRIQPTQDDPIDRFITRRLPEVLRGHLAESVPGTRLPEIIVDPKPNW
ncbi:methyltransferase domain-containing protein [Amycolatopsis sp. lyj-84]|uniref:methyltransferase domain-containing protein n=1 Tax=Amycolatopsis sp. lyj-84 TaxID=2789284 RepID=UPI00397E4AEC